jgi:hypothetical protein
MPHLPLGFVVELHGKGNQRVRQQGGQGEAAIRGRNDKLV